ncbi:MAG: GtrA family protein [Lachnospiraceae bacterium]|uniref:GtrA family protein n=1 Tax=Bacteroides caecimuris TaxID=1796613 RepID=UPI0026E52605|nr:GtrA family protein [Bacteroides caecimuris]MCM1222423.1 GtrA family protein [Lachnospiraceae bacterium]
MDKVISLIKRNRQLILYGLIGSVSSTADFAVYSALVMIGLNLLVANAVGVNIGIITSFCLNRRYNFKVTDCVKRRFMTFYSIGLVGLAVSTGLLYLLAGIMMIQEFYAKLLTIIVVAMMQFVLNKTITFKQKST